MTHYLYPVTGAAATLGPTPWQTVGPFFHFALPSADGPHVVAADRPAAFQLTGTVLDGAGAPVPDALIEVWQADEHGRLAASDGFRGFGRCATDPAGRYAFRTVKPGAVPTTDGRAQAPHLAVSVLARGMLRRAVTRIYLADEPDPLLDAVDPGRRPTLIAVPCPGGYRHDIHLQGPHETVFLDVGA